MYHCVLTISEISAVPEQDNYAIIVIVPIVATVVIVAVCIIVLLSKSRYVASFIMWKFIKTVSP